MILLFVHDHPFYIDCDNVYSGGGLPYSVWDNYLKNFNKVLVYARRSSNLKDRKIISSNKDVLFQLTEKYSSMFGLLRNVGRIKEELSDMIANCDVVLVRLPSVLGLLAAEVALKQKRALWVEQVGNAKEAFANHGSIVGKLIASGFDYRNRSIVKKADFVSYVTEYKLQSDYPCNENAITVSLSDVIIRNILAKSELDKNRFYSDELEIGLIGGFDTKYKGQDILIKAIAKLPNNIKDNIKINLVGKGDFNWILSIVKGLGLEKNIRYIGALEAGDQVDEFLKGLSLYVQPSLTEGMPRAIIEAMAMGCPVIGSKVGGIPDVVSENLVHLKNDVDSLSKNIEKLYNNRDLLFEEAISSLIKALPFSRSALDTKRNNFYNLMNKKLYQDGN